MIVSHSHQFIYLHSRKTAGTSIGVSLSRYLRPGDFSLGYAVPLLKAGYRPPDWQGCWRYMRPWDFRFSYPRSHAYRRMILHRHGATGTHMQAVDVKKLVGEQVWESYTKFSFERHPFDRIISFFYWRIKSLQQPPSFADFVKAIEERDQSFLASNNLLDWANLSIYSIDSRLAVDYLGRFECLQDDLRAITHKIGIAWDGWLPREKGAIRPVEATASRLITADLSQRLENVFSVEIKLIKKAAIGMSLLHESPVY